MKDTKFFEKRFACYCKMKFYMNINCFKILPNATLIKFINFDLKLYEGLACQNTVIT